MGRNDWARRLDPEVLVPSVPVNRISVALHDPRPERAQQRRSAPQGARRHPGRTARRSRQDARLTPTKIPRRSSRRRGRVVASRVAGGISAPGSHRSRRDSLPSPLRREARCCIPGAAGMNSKEGSWVHWLTQIRKVNGTIACQESDGQAQMSKAEASRDPRDKAKAELLEAQSPDDERERPPERHPIPAPCPATATRVRLSQPSGRGALPNEGNQGDEWDAYVTLGRMTATNAGSPTGREPHGHGVPIVVVRFTPHQGGREAVHRAKGHRRPDI